MGDSYALLPKERALSAMVALAEECRVKLVPRRPSRPAFGDSSHGLILPFCRAALAQLRRRGQTSWGSAHGGADFVSINYFGSGAYSPAKRAVNLSSPVRRRRSSGAVHYPPRRAAFWRPRSECILSQADKRTAAAAGPIGPGGQTRKHRARSMTAPSRRGTGLARRQVRRADGVPGRCAG